MYLSRLVNGEFVCLLKYLEVLLCYCGILFGNVKDEVLGIILRYILVK